MHHLADRIAVMYLGRIVELGPAGQVFGQARHPYTIALLASTPEPDPERKTLPITLEGNVPSLTAPPAGCHFHPRCPWAQELCRTTAPGLDPVEPGRAARCHFTAEIAERIAQQAGLPPAL